MGHTDGAHTHGSGGSGGAIALIAGGAILAAAIADPVAHAAAELVRIVVIAVAVVIGLAIAAGAALERGRIPGTASVPAARRTAPSGASPGDRGRAGGAPALPRRHRRGRGRGPRPPG